MKQAGIVFFAPFCPWRGGAGHIIPSKTMREIMAHDYPWLQEFGSFLVEREEFYG